MEVVQRDWRHQGVSIAIDPQGAKLTESDVEETEIATYELDVHITWQVMGWGTEVYKRWAEAS